jgi:hypothetical protein
VVRRLLQDETVWWVLRALLANDEPDAAVVRFDRLLSEYKRLVHPRRAGEPLSLPVEIADDLPLPREDWRLERSFKPIAGGFARRQNVVQETNLGDVRLGLDEGWVDSTLTTRARDAVGDVARARINVWGPPAAGRRRSGLTVVADDLADLRQVARHMVDWRLASEDQMWGKRRLEFGDYRLKSLPLDVLPGGRWDHVKTQVHSISFRLAGTSVPELGDHLASRFQRLIPADQATLVIEPPAPLAFGSEIRWTVAPVAITDPVQRVLDRLVARLGRIADISPEAADVVRRAFNYQAAGLDPSHRNFDVRVGAVTEPTPNHYGFTVVTLSNHPYGGGRSWQIVRHGDGLYSLTTAEFNTYAWLPDAVFELATAGENTRRLWYSQLRNFVADIGGVATAAADPTLAAVARSGDSVVDQDTSFLFGGQDTSETSPGFTQAVNRSPLGNWVRLNFPTLGEMVDAVFPPLPEAAAQ